MATTIPHTIPIAGLAGHGFLGALWLLLIDVVDHHGLLSVVLAWRSPLYGSVTFGSLVLFAILGPVRRLLYRSIMGTWEHDRHAPGGLLVVLCGER